MKLLVILLMLAALYLLYRIAVPKRKDTKKESSHPPKQPIDLSEVVVKSRFVIPQAGQPQPTHTTSLKTDFQEEKPDIFAAEIEKKEAAIPPERLDDAFASEPNPDDLDIEPGENEAGADDEPETEVDGEEEAEELRQTLGRDAERAGGWSVEEMEAAVDAVQNPTDEKAAILLKAEKTDLFEQLVSGDKGKADRITAIVERHVKRVYPEQASENENESKNDSDLENFDVAEFLD
ncbi:MAG: hypothetical protein LBV32_00690 [Tannerellaceae bacterium]|jgi:hypothetical protein|nr:hypothetical protein [Tannerellaceae bacterium]